MYEPVWIKKGVSIFHRCAQSRGYLCPQTGSSGSNDHENVKGFWDVKAPQRSCCPRALRRQCASAEFVSAKHYSLSTFCCYLSCSADRHISFSPTRKDGGRETVEAPVCLLFSKEIPSFSIRLLHPDQQTPFGPSDPSAPSQNF